MQLKSSEFGTKETRAQSSSTTSSLHGLGRATALLLASVSPPCNGEVVLTCGVSIKYGGARHAVGTPHSVSAIVGESLFISIITTYTHTLCTFFGMNL